MGPTGSSTFPGTPREPLPEGLHVGTSGWSYQHWRGRFYPSGLSQPQWFAYYARVFDTVEVNTSFYRIPKASMVDRWAALAPDGFRFALKLWRGLTHYKKLKDPQEHLGSFLDVAEGLPPAHRGPLLIQLPPNWGRDLERLDAFLETFARMEDEAGWTVAVELRNDDWLTQRTRRLLELHDAALVLHDMPGRAAATEPVDVDTVYVRRHGPNGAYYASYPADRIEADAERALRWHDQGRDVWVYYNNDHEAHAVEDARALQDLLAGQPMVREH